MILRTIICLSLLTRLAPNACSDEINTPEYVAVGMSTALTGQTADLGNFVKAGVEAAFREFNASSETQRQLRLIALDDGYEPRRTGPNMRQLIEHDNVVAILGNVGAPCAVTAVPIANETKTPLIGYVTGGAILRKTPPDHYVVNYRASLNEEATAIVEGFIHSGQINPEEIAFFTQRDTFGDSFFDGGIAALQKHGLERDSKVAHARYERNSIAIKRGLSELLLFERPIKAIALGAAGPPAVEFIREARKAGYDGLFATVSFVDAYYLAQQLGSDGDGVIVLQVVPHIHSDVPLAAKFRHAMQDRDSSIQNSFIAFEGYVIASMFCRALEQVNGPVTREKLITALLDLGTFDLGLGHNLKLTDNDHQACHRLWATVLEDGAVLEFDWSALRGQESPR